MSANVIRKQDLAKFGSWEPESFGEPGVHSDPPRKVKLPTADQIDRMQRNAHSEGFQQGYEEGRARAEAEAQALYDLMHALQSELDVFDREIAQHAMQFSLVLAQSMLRASLDARPEMIIPVIREALTELPTASGIRELHVHPLDGELLRAHAKTLLQLDQVVVVEDERIERGGCRVRNRNGEVDATLAARWRNALLPLGRDDIWCDVSERQQTNNDINS